MDFLFTFHEVRFSVLFIIYHLSFAPIHRARARTQSHTWPEPRTRCEQRVVRLKAKNNQGLRLPTKYYFHIYFVCIASFASVSIQCLSLSPNSRTVFIILNNRIFFVLLQLHCVRSRVCSIQMCEPQSVTAMQLQLRTHRLLCWPPSCV